jgi:lactate dehydrogenase-like 2-hydroxyacid dehydrogenase
MSPLPKPIKVAILDDYQSLSPPYLFSFSESDVQFTHFPETLSPYPDPQPLIDRLKDFHVICTMRERTPFPRRVVEGLKECKVLLTTGMRNLGLDLEAFKERGIIVAGTGGIPSPYVCRSKKLEF